MTEIHFIVLILIAIAFNLLILALAMFCRSLVHRLLHNYPMTKKAIEKRFKRPIEDQWWDPRISHTNKNTIKWTIDIFGFRWITKIMVQFSDAFHTFNTIELGCYDLIFTVLFCLWLGLVWWMGIIIFLITGVVFITLFFNLGYDKIWR